MADPAALEISDLRGFYEASQVLHGITLQVARGEVVTLIGRNGAGKTSTLRSIMGILEKRQGSIRVFGKETVSLMPEKIAKLGIGYVPEERGIYSTLSVAENLILPPIVKQGGMTVEEIHHLFPILYERRNNQGTRLSGGEQQMLAIARVLRTGAELLLLDEPTEGLAPTIVAEIGAVIQTTKQRGLTIVLVEQNFRFAADLADRHYVIESGRVIDVIMRAQVQANMARLERYLGI